EESHRGIVPMKHSNKDGTLSAESAEGRLRAQGEYFPHLTRTRLRAGLRVSHGWASVRTGCARPLFIQEKNLAGGTGQPVALPRSTVCGRKIRSQAASHGRHGVS